MTDRQNKALYIAERCKAAGMTLAGAAGVIANVEAESVFNPHNLQDTYERALGFNDESYTAAVDNGSYQGFTRDAAGYGLAQWTAGDRKAKMLAYFKQRGKSIGDFQTQVEYLIYEMRTGYAYAWRSCCTDDNAYNCGYAVCKYYEIPANTEQQAQYRGKQASLWLDWLKLNSGTASTIQPGQSAGEPAAADHPAEQPAAPSMPAGLELRPATESWPPRTIDAHCEGFPEIKLLQSLLACHGYSVVIDGIFAESLTHKVRQFQQSYGLSADGIVGPLTWAKLMDRG